MNTDSAIQWVLVRRFYIIRRSKKFFPYAPYDEAFYMSAAMEAAIVAATHLNDKDERFERKFWKKYEKIISTFVPNPLAKKGSKSIPSHLCEYPENISFIPEYPLPSEMTEEIEKIYIKIRKFIAPKYRVLLRKLLGLHINGRLTPEEAAVASKCSRQNIMKLFDGLCSEVHDLVVKGTLDFRDLLKDLPEMHLMPNHLNFRGYQTNDDENSGDHSSENLHLSGHLRSEDIGSIEDEESDEQ